MYELSIETDFAAAHNLRGYEGACERLHGHNWKVEVHITVEKLNKIGIALDFKELKAATAGVIDKLDHRYLNDVPPFDKLNTTAENLARFIHGELSAVLNDGNVSVKRVRVWESERAAAAYYE
ncbi:MAG: 6-carboxytetrahydropterin synthase QueD [Thermodesulfobacteriota bacterium]